MASKTYERRVVMETRDAKLARFLAQALRQYAQWSDGRERLKMGQRLRPEVELLRRYERRPYRLWRQVVFFTSNPMRALRWNRTWAKYHGETAHPVVVNARRSAWTDR